jgi:hypothetical protein
MRRNQLTKAGLVAIMFVLTACGGGAAGAPPPPVVSGEMPTTPAPGDSSPTPDPVPTPDPAPASDQTAPSGAVTSPKNGATLSALVSLTASASDPAVSGQTTSGVASVQFVVDGKNFGPSITGAPYTASWNTQLVVNGQYNIAVRVLDKAGNQAMSSTVAVTVNNAVPPPVTGSFSMPTVEDEKNTYRKWGWTWSPSVEPAAVTEPISNYYVADVDVHGDTESDDLWSYIMMYQRSGNPVYLNRARAWARYFKQDYRNCVGGSYESFCYDHDAFGADHLYGWGLVAWYRYTCGTVDGCDTAALEEAKRLTELAEGLYASTADGCYPSNGCLHYGTRGVTRHLILASYVAETTGDARYIALRDKIANIIMNAPEWDAQRGTYFIGDWATDYILGGTNLYAAGVRIQSAFQIGLLSEALYQTYRATGRADIRDRLISIARYIDVYGLDRGCQLTASWFGVKDGKAFHSYSDGNTTGCTATSWDSSYSISLVNTLMMGYKLSGDRNLYDRAKFFFNRGTKGIYGDPNTRTAGDNEVHHFVDTNFAHDFWLAFNKGELQYTYLLFDKDNP